MAEILIWQGYCQQFGLTYHFKRKYGISLLILALFGVVAALLKVWSYTRRLREPETWNFPWSPGNVVVVIGTLFEFGL